jgi:hypothetical protein
MHQPKRLKQISAKAPHRSVVCGIILFWLSPHNAREDSLFADSMNNISLDNPFPSHLFHLHHLRLFSNK